MLKRLFKSDHFSLMIFSKSFEQLSEDSNFGGLPVYNKGENFSWPKCACCRGNMQYLGKVNDGKYIYLIFMCQNDPGCCDEWDPDEGGNKVIKFEPSILQIIDPPEQGEALRNTEYGCKVIDFKDLSYNDARDNWSDKNKIARRNVLGLLGGKPEWLQNDDTPKCVACNQEMSFVSQLETGPHYQTEMNFGGGGCAYLFSCNSCNEQAKFLWQC